ncbi:MAG: DUF4845 domain-containing protein [Methylococcaceae bacterium]|nr:DUF4845 domain-containing protein [Methylococcaceae bacterium]OYV23441.1 MAG: hypothetical protein CG442_198 [Methylococcaceae bacterium NSO1]
MNVSPKRQQGLTFISLVFVLGLINYVNDVTQDDITVTKQGNYLKVAIEYEVVRKIAGNLSVLVEFNDAIEVGEK